VTSPSFNVFAGSAEVFESLRPEKNVITEALRARYLQARIAGFKGDLEEYARLFEKRR